MKRYIGNEFSLQMIPDQCLVRKNWIPDQIMVRIAQEHDLVSCIGHEDIANVVSNLLGKEIPTQRTSIELNPFDELYIAQVMGGRLPEGATTLPEGVMIRFFKVELVLDI